MKMKIEEIKKAKTKKLGKKIEYYEQIDSTHKYAKTIAQKNESDGKVIIAEVQTDGIGTKGRSWYTGQGKNIAMTIILHTKRKVMDIKDLPIKVAKIVKKTIKELYNCDLKIKPPNDLMLNNKKICGILTQTNIQGEKVNYILISMGFNVNETRFPEEVKDIATSLKNEYKKEFDREDILSKILENIEKEIDF